MNFLKVDGKKFLITGVANKKSVATFIAKELIENGADVIFSAQSEKHIAQVNKLFPEKKCIICDVESEDSIKNLSDEIEKDSIKLDGIVHSIAFANFSEGLRPFHETNAKDFLQATNISCFSLISLSNALKNSLNKNASIVTISISSTKVTSYGYLGPIKAALDSAVLFLAKSFSEFSNIRFNAVCAGPLKTSASAGIPNYVDNYLFAEQLTLRHESLKTQEVADTACYLLSSRSSGVNATGIVVDAGMSCNYFDEKVVSSFSN